MTYKFTMNVPVRDGDVMIRAMETRFGYPFLEAWCNDDCKAITSDVDGVILGENEVILDHNFMGPSNKSFVDSLIEYLCSDSREIIFGGWKTKTLVLKLKDNWRDLVVPMEV